VEKLYRELLAKLLDSFSTIVLINATSDCRGVEGVGGEESLCARLLDPHKLNLIVTQTF